MKRFRVEVEMKFMDENYSEIFQGWTELVEAKSKDEAIEKTRTQMKRDYQRILHLRVW